MAGMQGLTGLTGLTPTVVPTVVEDSGAPAEQIHGTTANPAHGQWTWDNPVPWSLQQGLDLSSQPSPGTGAGMLGDKPLDAGAGQDPEGYADASLTHSHAAPWPWEHIPNSGAVDNAVVTAAQSQANQALHAYDAGDAREFTHIEPPTDHKMPWGIEPLYVSQGLEAGVPVGGLTGNNRTGWDRFAGWTGTDGLTRAEAPGTSYPAVGSAGGNLNSYGFDSAHVTRFTPLQGAQVPVPQDTTQGTQRPMVMNVPGRYGSYPVGQGSPFQGQLPGVGNDVGAAEIGVGSDYQAPPTIPTNAPLQQSASSAPVWGYSGLGY
jgi:hypothetical protein